MTINYKGWKNLFLFCLGLFVGTAICMKWMEKEFLQDGSLFTIIGLEISYSRDQVVSILSGLEEPVRSLLRYHLRFDFAFMAGVYPGIAALCMMARFKTQKAWLRNLLLAMALLQLPAFACDVTENLFLLKWLADPGSVSDFDFYHAVVWVKWALALSGALLSIPFAVRRMRKEV